MVDCRLAADLPDPPRGPEPIEFAHDSGAVLAVSADRAPGRRGHPAARAPRTPADEQHAQRDLRLPGPVLHRQRVSAPRTGVCFVGAGFASIYPLVAEAIGRRFPYYHPGFFNGIFSFALVGGLLAPATLGYAASIWGVGVVMGIPLLGTFLVMALLPLIWLESKVTGR